MFVRLRVWGWDVLGRVGWGVLAEGRLVGCVTCCCYATVYGDGEVC